jgi:inosose dehydratase
MAQSRRHFLASSLGALAAQAAAAPAIRFATGGYIWEDNIEEAIRTTTRFGFRGIEPFRQHILKYLDKPQTLKAAFDSAGLTLVTCSNGGPMSVNLIDPAKTGQTIEDHVRFAREFLIVFGCRHFKINLGRRPMEPTTEEQLKTMAGTLNKIGSETAKFGIRIAPHPHIWSPLEREHEVERMLELTDPNLVSWVADMAQLTLGGIDPVAIVRKHAGRLAGVHFKDTDSKYRGYRGPTPSTEEHRKVTLYKNLGAGGVDFPAIMKILREKRFAGWITLDFDPPRPGTGTIDDILTVNKQYLIDKLHVTL